jgi:PPIC-type PPIASE domain/SurA-like N-terminal domain
MALLTLTACSGLMGLATPSPTPRPPTPSATPEPLAAQVDGEWITLAEFDREVARYKSGQQALGIDLATVGDYRKLVLRAMIEERVVVHAALAEGLTVDAAAVAQAVDQARAARGGEAPFAEWLGESGYTIEEFTLALKRQMLSRQITDQVADAVPTSAEQVHAAHILVTSQSVADEVRLMIASGADFAATARTYSQDLSTRAGGGDLGWFPRGWLAVPEVEAAAFALAPGETSAVISAADGFHIVRTLEEAPARPISAVVREALQRNAVRSWIDEQVAASAVQVFVALP